MYAPRSISDTESARYPRTAVNPRVACGSSVRIVPYKWSIEKIGVRLFPNGIYLENGRHHCVERVHAPARLFYLDSFPQLARSISHTQITHVPSPLNVPVIYVLVLGRHRSRSLQYPRIRPTASFDEQIARDQTTSMTPTAEWSLICVLITSMQEVVEKLLNLDSKLCQCGMSDYPYSKMRGNARSFILKIISQKFDALSQLIF